MKNRNKSEKLSLKNRLKISTKNPSQMKNGAL